jgi:hypothetical protein
LSRFAWTRVPGHLSSRIWIGCNVARVMQKRSCNASWPWLAGRVAASPGPRNRFGERDSTGAMCGLRGTCRVFWHGLCFGVTEKDFASHSSDALEERFSDGMRLIILLLVALVVSAAQALGQAVEVHLSDPTCDDCGAGLTEVVRLGATAGPGMLQTEAIVVAVDSRGRYYVSDDERPAVNVFDSLGGHVAEIGRRGEGPGEFSAISAIAVGPHDSLYVYDPALGRMSVFTPELELARTEMTGIRASFDNALIEAGWVVNAHVPTPEAVGYPLHLIEPSGSLARSFGSRSGIYRPDTVYGVRRGVAAAGADAVWSAWLNQYVIERWRVDGTLELALVRKPDWFEPYWETNTHADNPPVPYLRALAQDGDLLWVLVRVAREDWRSALTNVSPDGRSFEIADRSAYEDTILEVIDLGRGEVLWSQRFNEPLYGFVGPRLVYGPVLDAIGNPFASVWRVEPL